MASARACLLHRASHERLDLITSLTRLRLMFNVQISIVCPRSKSVLITIPIKQEERIQESNIVVTDRQMSI